MPHCKEINPAGFLVAALCVAMHFLEALPPEVEEAEPPPTALPVRDC